jgi:hypothetical protein
MNVEFFKVDEEGFVNEVTLARKLSVKKMVYENHAEYVYRFDFPKLTKETIATFVYHTLNCELCFVDKILFVSGKKGEVIVWYKVFQEY